MAEYAKLVKRKRITHHLFRRLTMTTGHIDHCHDGDVEHEEQHDDDDDEDDMCGHYVASP